MRMKSKAATAAPTVGVVLPTEASELSDDLRDYSMLVHGEKKIGKTSLLAQEEGAFFLEWDPLQKALKILQAQMTDWRTYLAYVKALEEAAAKGKLPYRTVVVDGVGMMYNAAFEYTCKRLCITHPHDENDFGKSWRAISDEFNNGLLRLMRIPGLSTRFICHSGWKETETRRGDKIERLVPILTGQAEEALVGLIDIWAAYVYEQGRRVLVVDGDERTGAGNRVEHRFRTPKGERVREIPMGTSPREAYANLLRAFRNEQSTVDGATPASTGSKGGKVLLKKKG